MVHKVFKSLFTGGVKLFQLFFVLMLVFSLVGVQRSQVVLAQSDITADFSWTAYNDLVYRTGQPQTNITKFTIPGEGRTSSGKLINFNNGDQTLVTATISASGVQGFSGNDEYDGKEANSGTDAYKTFHDIVDSAGLIIYGDNSSWYVDLTFTGLSPAKTYTFATTANRNRNEANYISRVSRFTISDVDSATNASTEGVTVINDLAVAFSTGYNTVNGNVARWTGIKPGEDGDFTVRVNADSGNEAYGPSVFMLAEESTILPTHIVTFDANGGEGTMADQSANAPTALTENEFTRTGYTFTGWNIESNGSGMGYADKAEYSFTANITLYAQWTANKYTVTFDANGGTPVTETKQVTFGTAYGPLPTTSRTAYIFTGWFTAASGGTQVEADTLVKTASAHTLYAHWETINIYLPLVLR